MKILKYLLFIGLLISTHSSVNAQVLAWEFNGNAGNEATVNSTTTDPNINTSILSRGTGITPSALGNSFSSTTYDGATLAAAVTNQEFVQFTASPKTGYQLSLSTLDVNFRRSGTGPDMFQWQYSLDGFATAGTNFGGTITYTNTATNGIAQAQINLSGISQLQNIPSPNVVTFRLYGWNATANTGTFALGRLAGNDLAIGGSLSPVLAANANVGGRVSDVNGNGIARVQVKISGGELSEPINLITSPLGYFSFEVPVGQTYILTVSSKNYTFSNPNQVINVNDNVTNLNFIAEQR